MCAAAGPTGASGEPGIAGATGSGLTNETVTSAGTGTALVGNLTAKLTATGEYDLSDETGEPVLKGCAIVVTVNEVAEAEPARTAQAAATGPHTIKVLTYAGPTLADNSFSLMVTCP